MTTQDQPFSTTRDSDPIETQEWIDALDALTEAEGAPRAQFLLAQLQDRARLLGVTTSGLPYSAYRNTIPVAQQPAYPGDMEIEAKLNSRVIARRVSAWACSGVSVNRSETESP